MIYFITNKQDFRFIITIEKIYLRSFRYQERIPDKEKSAVFRQIIGKQRTDEKSR